MEEVKNINKKRVLLYKTLVIGIILLFIGISISPVITAVFNDTEVNYEPTVTSKKKSYDEYEEIITLIRGPGRFTWIEKKGILRGEIEIERITGFGGPNLFGLRHSNGGRERYREENVVYVRAYDFIRLPMRWGIALGNIDWMTL